jgi:methylmalonyl-CoA mutase N-terminal domain/subunit
MDQHSPAGEFPYRSGIHPGMYTTKPWTIRQYAGFGTPEQTNKKFKELIAEGVTGLSVAFDLPTQMGLDPDDEFALGEVGRIGVSVSKLDDMRTLLAGIPLNQISISMTINSTAPIIYMMYCIVAEERGFKLTELRGTLQNDVLKEFISRNTHVFGPELSMYLTTGLIKYSLKSTPKWNPISISGYHMSEAGATNVQELAFTFTNAIAYIEDLLKNDLTIDEIAPRLSFFFSAKLNIIEEVAKFRAARQVFAELIQERYRPQNELSTRLRFHTQTAGSELTANQPEVNLVRVTIQAMAAVLGGTQSLHTNSYDEAHSLPTDFSASLAIETQNILQQQTDLMAYVDPFCGSRVVEDLTDHIVSETENLISEITNLGGALNAIKLGYQKSAISTESLRIALDQEGKKKLKVQVMDHKEESAFRQENVIGKLTTPEPLHFKEEKEICLDGDALKSSLLQIEKIEENATQLMDKVKSALVVGATLGEVVSALKKREGLR